MASLEILLNSVRSDTPTSFFLVLSKTAFLTCSCPTRFVEGGAVVGLSFLRPARFVTAWEVKSQRKVRMKNSLANNQPWFYARFRLNASLQS